VMPVIAGRPCRCVRLQYAAARCSRTATVRAACKSNCRSIHARNETSMWHGLHPSKALMSNGCAPRRADGRRMTSGIKSRPRKRTFERMGDQIPDDMRDRTALWNVANDHGGDGGSIRTRAENAHTRRAMGSGGAIRRKLAANAAACPGYTSCGRRRTLLASCPHFAVRFTSAAVGAAYLGSRTRLQ
jgi:hypothetical protein